METFDSKASLIEALGNEMLAIINEAIEQKGVAKILLSGGSTPKDLYLWLSKQNLDFSKIKVGLVDERYVPLESPYSNEALVASTFYHNTTATGLIGMVADTENPEQNLKLVAEQYSTFKNADLVLLGMGDDGHTASIFPNDSASTVALLEKNAGICYTKAPSIPENRITCNKVLLDSALHTFLMLTGSSKLFKFEAASEEKTPISFFQGTRLKVYYTPN
jgi:6-phosphogluconolactonase